jgi:hypothetical protein
MMGERQLIHDEIQANRVAQNSNFGCKIAHHFVSRWQ